MLEDEFKSGICFNEVVVTHSYYTLVYSRRLKGNSRNVHMRHAFLTYLCWAVN
jgi:hypothetical protein